MVNNLCGFNAAPIRFLSTWDGSKTGGTINLSNGSLTVVGGGADWNQVLSVYPIPSGLKVYTEFKINVVAAANNFMFGVKGLSGSYTSSNYIGSNSDGWSWQPNVQKWNNGVATALASGCAANDIMMLAVDMLGGKIWFGRNGTWAEGNPATGSTASYSNLTGTLYIAQSTFISTDKQTANFGATAFTYPPPSGFWGGLFKEA